MNNLPKPTIYPDNIPGELKISDIWIIWRKEPVENAKKPKKTPYQTKNPQALAANNRHVEWSDFKSALFMYQNDGSADGIGAACITPYVFIDIDDCIENGILHQDIQHIVDTLETYTEISQSETGLHLIGRAVDLILPETKRTIIKAYKQFGIQIATTNQFLYITGNIYQNRAKITRIDSRLKTLANEVVDVPEPPPIPSHIRNFSSSICDNWGLSLSGIGGLPDDRVESGPGKYRGSHPVHGSTTKNNYRTDGDVWYCERDGHKTGGGPLEFFAVKEGIINCEDVRPGCLDNHWQQVFTALESSGFKPREKVQKKTLPPLESHPRPKQTTAVVEAPLIDQTDVSSHLFEYTEIGIANLIKKIYSDNWFYVANSNDWYRWTGKHWDLDTTLQFTELVKSVVISRLTDAAANNDKTARDFYNKCCDTVKINHIITSCRSLFAIPPEKVDALSHLFPFQNGVYNLISHEFLPEHIRTQYLTKISPVEFVPDAACPMWDEHMQTVFENDQQLILFFQEVCGYALLHNNPAQAFFVLHGSGQNGKSETSKVIKKIMGSYAKNAQVETIMKKKTPSDGSTHRADLVHIARARMVQVFEGNPEDELAAGLIKQLTGGDPLTARGAYEKHPGEFAPGFKIWFVTNHLPMIDGADYALMRRVFLIPFHATIPDSKKILDYAERLYSNESSGILNWMLAGLQRYQIRGKFNIPKKVKDAIQKYKTGNDILLEWMEDECVKEPSSEIQKEILLQNYRNWCDGNGSKALPPKTFWTALRNRGVETEGVYVNRKRGCKGIRLKTIKEVNEFYEQWDTSKTGNATHAAE